MNRFKSISLSLAVLLFSVAVTAQETVSLAAIIRRLPLPPATLQQALQKERAEAEAALAIASKVILKGTDEAYRPLYAHFVKNLQAGAANSSAYSAVERKLYGDYSSSAKGLTAANQYLQFQLLMASRPFMHSGLLSWGLPGNFSGGAKDWHRQALSLEKKYGPNLPQKNALMAKLDFGVSDPALSAIHAAFNKELAALPKRTAHMPEGFTLEVEDPDKAMAAYSAYGKKKQAHFAQKYRLHFATWQAQFGQVSSMAEQVEALAAQAPANTPEAAVLLSDLQGRLWNAAIQLYQKTEQLWQEVFLAQLDQQQLQEAIQVYTGYKARLQ